MKNSQSIVYSDELRRRLTRCPPGRPGWQEFESAALATLRHLFVPPLTEPIPQQATLSRQDRRDAVFRNRVLDASSLWSMFRHDHDAKYLIVEFKNYDRDEIGKDAADQVRNYMKAGTGRLALLCCNKPPGEPAYRRRNSIYSEEKKIILFLTTLDMIEMLDIKDRGDDPAGFIADAIDLFILRHE